jgi:hypothetical protein
MFTKLQNVMDSDDYTDELVSNELNRIYDESGEVDDRRLAAFLLFKHSQGDVIRPDDVEIAKYDDFVLSYGREDYLVLTDSDADDRWDESLDSYIDGCMEIPEHIMPYFDREAWKSDARHDGRGHCLASYDGDEHESRDYFIYRVN